jgi:tetratricopeptide (TPR) repeat protein
MVKRFLVVAAALAVAAAVTVPLTIPAFAINQASDREEMKRRKAEQLPPVAQKALIDKKYDEAIELFTKAIDSGAFKGRPDVLGQLYFGRGQAFHGKGECQNAIPDYTKAAEYVSKGDIHYALAACHLNLQQMDQALAAIDQAVKIDPEAVIYRSARCKILFNKKDFAGALPDCEKALTKITNDKDLMVATAQAAERRFKTRRRLTVVQARFMTASA